MEWLFRDFKEKMLIKSIGSGDLTTLRMMIGEDRNIVNWRVDHFTPLHIGVVLNQLEVVKVLLENGAVQVTNRYGITPLMFAAREGYTDIVTALVASNKSGLDMKMPSDDATALSLAVEKGHHAIVKILLESGAEQLPDNQGFSPLMRAVDEARNSRNVTMIRLLLSNSTAGINHPIT